MGFYLKNSKNYATKMLQYTIKNNWRRSKNLCQIYFSKVCLKTGSKLQKPLLKSCPSTFESITLISKHFKSPIFETRLARSYLYRFLNTRMISIYLYMKRYYYCNYRDNMISLTYRYKSFHFDLGNTRLWINCQTQCKDCPAFP